MTCGGPGFWWPGPGRSPPSSRERFSRDEQIDSRPPTQPDKAVSAILEETPFAGLRFHGARHTHVSQLIDHGWKDGLPASEQAAAQLCRSRSSARNKTRQQAARNAK